MKGKLTYVLLLLTGILSAQHQTLPYNKWIDLLSVKTDLKTANLFKVRDELISLDSLTCIAALEELGKRGAMHQHTRFKIRYNFLKIHSKTCITSSADDYSLLELAKEALHGFGNLGGDFATVAYFKDEMGIVHLRGTVDRAGDPDDLVILTLPVGYRPTSSGRLMFGAMNNAAIARVDINVAGQVIVVFGGTGYISLDGITFRAD